MAWIFGDSFDLYAIPADATAGYWDSGTTTGFTLQPGRFTGRGLQNASNTAWLVKSSGANDAVHHIVCAFEQTAALTGTTLGMYLSLGDGATAQCSIVFRSDGAILLTSGGPAGAALATYTGATTTQGQWFAYEFEIVISNTAGSFTVRKNGNASNDFTLGSLNTRGGTTNNYANRLTLGQNAAVTSQLVDDLLWRSDPSSVAFVGDIRCYTRMPASDASTLFTRNMSTTSQQPFTQGSTAAISNATAHYTPLTAAFDGTIGTVILSLGAGYTGNMKCALFANSATGTPGAVLGSATPVANPVTGNNTFTFATPVAVTHGVQYWVGFTSDTSSGTWNTTFSGSQGATASASYTAFPTANPTAAAANPIIVSWTLTIGSNATLTSEAQEDGATSYVYDSNPGDADFYTIVATAQTPASVVAVTTRGLAQKSDAGSRTGAVQLKSGGTAVASPTTAVPTTWAWLWRTDTVDPATGAAWTAVGVNNVQIGPTVVS